MSFLDDRGEYLVAARPPVVHLSVVFGRACEGRPAAAHLGAVATALDNAFVRLLQKALGDVVMNADVAVTASLEVELLGSVPLEAPLAVEARLTKVERGKGDRLKFHLAAALRPAAGGAELARAASLFVGKGSVLPAYQPAAL